jgi:hypothetical protein
LIEASSNQSQVLLGGYTCAEYFDLASSAQTLDYCEILRVGQLVCCEETKKDDDSCHVCESGAEMELPNRRITLLADNVTCETYDRELEAYAQYPYCDGLPGFHFASYCHCEGAKAPKTCPFCNGVGLINPNLAVYIDGLDVWLTCEELATAAVHTTDENLCSLLNARSYECCGVEAPADADISSRSACQICDSDAQMTLADRPIIAHVDSDGNALTCASFDQYLRSESKEVCQGILEEESIDLATYCGCSGSLASPNVCQPICGVDMKMTDPNILITLDNVNVTCGQAELLNAFFVDESLCAANFPVLQATCCASLQTFNSLSVFGTQMREYKKYIQHTADDWIEKQGVNPTLPTEFNRPEALTEAFADSGLGTSDGSLPDVATMHLPWIAYLGIIVLLLR